MGGDFYVLEPVVGVDDHDFGGNRIPRRKLGERRWRLHFVGHRHGVHESGNLVAVDDGRLLLSIDGHDAAGEGVAFRGGRFRSITSCGGDSSGESERNQNNPDGGVHTIHFSADGGSVPFRQPQSASAHIVAGLLL
jgi:hypothetical protein